MTLVPSFFAQVRALIGRAPQTPIPKGLNNIPNPSAWPPRDKALQELVSATEDLQNQITSLTPAVSPSRRLYLTKNATDQYGGNLNNAIAAAQALTPAPSAANPVVIEILSPGTYTGNFTLVPGLFLVAVSAGPAQGTVLTSTSGVTLTLPEGNSGVQGVDVSSTSANVADAAIEVVAIGNPNAASFLELLDIQAPGGATALRTVPGTSTLLPLVVAGVNGISTNPLMDLQGAGFVAIFGFFINDGTGTVASITNGSFAIVLNAVVSNAPGGAGWLFDVDGGMVAIIGPTRFFSASNLVRASNGAFVLVFDLTGFSDPSGTVLEVDGTSIAQIGNNFIGAPLSTSAYAGWVGTTTANTFFTPTLGWATGTTGGPDQRPPAPQPGMRFFATDLAPGAEQLTFVPGTGWVNQAGAVVP